MRDEIWEKANKALSRLAEEAHDTASGRQAIDDIQNLLYRYHEATNALAEIEAKIFHFKRGANE